MRDIAWQAPREGWVRFNTDGAAKGDVIFGCGGVRAFPQFYFSIDRILSQWIAKR
jgi:hypothetical protein